MIWATSITDASFDHETHAAAWAAWIRVDGLRESIKEHGAFRETPAGVNEAELYAALNGVWLAVNRGFAHAVLVQTDSLAVVQAVNRKHRLYTDTFYDSLRDAGLHKVTLKARHVKGHTAIGDARSWVNRWCDKHAKQTMRQQRTAV